MQEHIEKSIQLASRILAATQALEREQNGQARTTVVVFNVLVHAIHSVLIRSTAYGLRGMNAVTLERLRQIAQHLVDNSNTLRTIDSTAAHRIVDQTTELYGVLELLHTKLGEAHEFP